MPDFQVPGAQPAGALQPQRPIAGAQPAPAAGIPGMPPPPPAPGMAPDQAQLPPAGAKDPAVLTNIAMFSHQLYSNSPIDVSMALGALEQMGPTYAMEVNAAVRNALSPGLDPMKTQVLIDFVVRHQIKECVPMLQALTSDANNQNRIAASAAYAKLAGPAQMPGMPGAMPGAPAGAPGGVPGQAPGATPAAMAYTPGGTIPPQFIGVVERLKDFKTAPDAAVEIAHMPNDQIAMIAHAVLTDPTTSERVVTMMTAILAKKAPDPQAIANLRLVLNNPSTAVNMTAKTRAAVALIYFGEQRDLPAILHLVADQNLPMPVQLKKVVIDSLTTKPDVLKMPAVVNTLQVVMNDRGSFLAGQAAAHALSLARSPAARDALGTSRMLTDGSYSADERRWVLGWLNAQPAPYNQATIDILKRLVASKEPGVADKAQALLKKTHA